MPSSARPPGGHTPHGVAIARRNELPAYAGRVVFTSHKPKTQRRPTSSLGFASRFWAAARPSVAGGVACCATTRNPRKACIPPPPVCRIGSLIPRGVAGTCPSLSSLAAAAGHQPSNVGVRHTDEGGVVGSGAGQPCGAVLCCVSFFSLGAIPGGLGRVLFFPSFLPCMGGW